MVSVAGWGRYPSMEAKIDSPVSEEALRAMLHSARARSERLIVRGCGRGYGDCALAPNILDMRAFDTLGEFDDSTGDLRCLAGVALDDLLRVFLPRGWAVPVSPGTRYVTLGGAVASDVHGKNHHKEGSFARHIRDMRVMLADGSIVSCSRRKHADLFHAVCGGMGLLGIVLELTLRMKRVPSVSMLETSQRARNLRELTDLLERNAETTYSVAWIDCLARGRKLGRGVLFLAEHAEAAGWRIEEKRGVSVPCNAPSFLLNPLSMRAFNALYYGCRARKPVERIVAYDKFFYPLDSIRHWNRIYGKRGFLQYQCLVPKQDGYGIIEEILERVAATGQGSFLAVLKTMGRGIALSPLSFPQEGYTLALDFQHNPRVFALLESLDALVHAVGGRVYLTKDARLSKKNFRKGYPRWKEFRALRRRVEADTLFASRQSQRLGL